MPITGFLLDLIECAEVPQSLLSDCTAVIGVDVVELTPCVRGAAYFDDPSLEQRLVTRVIVTDEFAGPVPQERSSVLTAATFRKVVDHDRQFVVFGGAVTPQVRPVRSTEA